MLKMFILFFISDAPILYVLYNYFNFNFQKKILFFRLKNVRGNKTKFTLYRLNTGYIMTGCREIFRRYRVYNTANTINLRGHAVTGINGVHINA